MNKRILIGIILMAITAAGWMVTHAATPIPIDDAYYQTGDEMRNWKAQSAIDAYLAGDSITNSDEATNVADTPCKPNIVFLSVTDTTVTAIIHRCPAQ